MYHLSDQEWKTYRQLQEEIFIEPCLKYSILRLLDNDLDDIIEEKTEEEKEYKLTKEVDLKGNRGLGELLKHRNINQGFRCTVCNRHSLNAHQAKKHKAKKHHYYWELKQGT